LGTAHCHLSVDLDRNLPLTLSFAVYAVYAFSLRMQILFLLHIHLEYFTDAGNAVMPLCRYAVMPFAFNAVVI